MMSLKLRSRDYLSFAHTVGDDVYKKAGDYNLFMVCHKPDQTAYRELPYGYSFRLCKRDELGTWKHIAVEKPYINDLSDYFERVYAHHGDEFFHRCMFICDRDGKPAATCLTWLSYRLIHTIGWFRTLPEYEGKGLGRALLTRIMETSEYPIYLHTQPTSARAIKLYSDFGFMLITDPYIGNRKNHIADSLPILQKVLPQADFDNLKMIRADKALLDAARLSEYAEF